MARNALLGFALFAAVATLAGCSGKADEAQAADAQLAALRAHTDSLRKEHIQAAPADSAGSVAAASDSAVADSASLAATPSAAMSDSAKQAEIEAALADSVQKAREIEVMRETFAYGGGTRDPFSSLINTSKDGPEIADLELVGVYQDLRTPSNSLVVLREKVSSKRHKLHVGDQLSRARLVQIRPRDAVFMIQDFGFERQETLSLRKQEVDTP